MDITRLEFLTERIDILKSEYRIKYNVIKDLEKSLQNIEGQLNILKILLKKEQEKK